MHACTYQDEKFPFYCEFVECLRHERVSDFVKWFSCFYWHASCFFPLHAINMVYVLIFMLNQPCIPETEFHSVVMVHNHGAGSSLVYSVVQVLYFLTDLSCLPIHYRKLGIKLSNYYCWTVYFSLQLSQILLHVFWDSVVLYIYIFVIAIYSQWIEPFTIPCCSLSLAKKSVEVYLFSSLGYCLHGMSFPILLIYLLVSI